MTSRDSESAVARGAEATLRARDHMGRPSLAKVREAKPYRHPLLDARLRDERTRDEANLLAAARAAGVPVPVVLDVDRANASLVLERIAGEALRDVLPRDDDVTARRRLGQLGRLAGRLHDAGVSHGDLTTSNVLVPDAVEADRLVLIDFGLGAFGNDLEPQGVDLHLVEEALEATDARAASLVEAFLAGYKAERGARAAAVLGRLGEIRERGRYR